MHKKTTNSSNIKNDDFMSVHDSRVWNDSGGLISAPNSSGCINIGVGDDLMSTCVSIGGGDTGSDNVLCVDQPW